MNNNILNVNGLQIGGNNPVRIMGVINLSPESFYSESVVTDSDALASRVISMTDQGADILDIGAASTAPKSSYGTEDTAIKDELARVTASLEIIKNNTDLPLSIDTTSSLVAEAALDLGVSIVNDISGLQTDKKMAKLVADRDVPLVIMTHCPNSCNSVEESLKALRESIAIAKETGIQRENLILDPGIGFGKPPEVDYALLRELKQFKDFQRPLLVGVSRKAFIGKILGEEDPGKRLTGTIAATAIAVTNGADIIRAHDVTEAVTASKIGQVLR